MECSQEVARLGAVSRLRDPSVPEVLGRFDEPWQPIPLSPASSVQVIVRPLSLRESVK
jgi:hypothetical protein